jgi:triosephosphate isomerase
VTPQHKDSVTMTRPISQYCSSLLLPLLLAISEVHAFAPSGQLSSSHTALFAGRTPLICGNWKLNPSTIQEAVDLAAGISNSVPSDKRDVILFVPFPFLDSVQQVVGNSVKVGAQMIYPQDSGAFTGAVSVKMLKSLGINAALAGHSERRTLYKETNQDIHDQCVKLIENDMTVVLCIGETLEEFEKDLVESVCSVQLKKALAGISAQDVLDKVVIAYEPVWAIGTGKVATPQIAQSVHKACRQILADLYSTNVADAIRILYGGSVTPDSIDGLMAQPDIDGALVGGASLDAEKFGRIINYRVSKRSRLWKSVKKAISWVK